MADSPKCLECLALGKTAQMYRMAGTQSFRCRDCGKVKNRASFESIEYDWKVSPEAWKEYIKSKGINVQELVQ